MSCKQVTSCFCQKVYHRDAHPNEIFLIFNMYNIILCKDIVNTVCVLVRCTFYCYSSQMDIAIHYLCYYGYCLCLVREK